MLDPYYRTLLGFQSLVQKEWVAGGHAFLDRSNHLHLKDKVEVGSVCPVFCVYSVKLAIETLISPVLDSSPLSLSQSLLEERL